MASSNQNKKEVLESQGFWDNFTSFQNLRSIGILLLLIFCVRWTVAAPYNVPTASMEPTIKVGDRILANHLSYHLRLPFTNLIVWTWNQPRVGEIVVFASLIGRQDNMVKRVVAVAGDEVEFIDGYLWVNGQKLTLIDLQNDRQILDDVADDPENKNLYLEQNEGRSYFVTRDQLQAQFSEFLNWPRDDVEGVVEGRYAVPDGQLFVIGDNRDNSIDSRAWGAISTERVLGRATYVIWSLKPSEGWQLDFRFARFFHRLN